MGNYGFNGFMNTNIPLKNVSDRQEFNDFKVNIVQSLTSDNCFSNLGEKTVNLESTCGENLKL